MSNSFAMIFPGQGSQSVGMLSELSEKFSEIKDTFEEASTAFGENLWELSQNGPEDKLSQTSYTQPALLAADVAVWRCWNVSGGVAPEIMAGHSLGEYAALVCAGVISFQVAIKLVAARGRFMQDAVATGEGAMAAIIGMDDEQVAKLCEEASTEGVVSPANFNAIGQVVVAGETAAVEKVIALAKSAGARMAKMIPVSVPSHCVLMEPAAVKMAEMLETIEFREPAIPVVQNVDAKTHNTPNDIRLALIKQLVCPVRWVETIQLMGSRGVNTFFECGPNRVLSGLNKRIYKDITCISLSTVKDIEEGVKLQVVI